MITINGQIREVGGSNPSQIIPKTLQMVRAAFSLDVQHLKG